MDQADSAGGNLIRLAISRPVTVLVGVVLTVLLGALSVSGLPIQLTPDITVPTLTVTTRWPGAAPPEIEMEILEEQEDALKSVPGLARMKSEAKPNEAVVSLEFDVGTPLDEALVRVSNRLTQVPEYPEAAREPVIATANNAGPPLAVITIQTLDRKPVSGYRTWVEQAILPQLERIPGVASIRHLGGQDSEVHVDFDVAALAERGLTVQVVARRIRAELENVSGGDLTIGKRRYVVRTPLVPPVPEQLERIVLGAGEDGTPITLHDVARVEVGLRKPTGVAFSDDGPSMVLLLFREAGSNVLEVSEEVRSTVERLDHERFAPEGLEMSLIFDQTGYIHGALELVRKNLLLGAVLAILVLLAFLRSISAAAVVGVSIPVCVFGTALGMGAFGRTINVVSLAGMAFAVGMVVDNSIVVLESIDTWRRRVPTAARAALEGSRSVWGAILASTVTTAAVFVPVIGWRDEVGELLRDVAVAISFAVSVSLLVSVLVIPSFAARLLKSKPVDPAASESWGSRFRRGVGRQVTWLTRRWPRALLTVVLAIGGSLSVAAALLPALEYLPTGNRNLIFGILVPPPGYAPREIEAIGHRVQADIVEHWRVEKDGVPAISRSFFVGDPNRIVSGVVAEDPTKISELVPFFRNVQSKTPGMFAFAEQASLFATQIGGGRAVEVEVSAADLPAVVSVGKRLLRAISDELPGSQIRPIPSLELGAPEIQAVPRRDEAAGLAMGGDELGLVVDALIDGAIVGEYGREGEPKIDVVLRAASDGRDAIDDPESLATAAVATPSGDVVPLGTLAQLTEQLGPTVIQRIERRRAVILQVSPPEDIPLEQAMNRIRANVVAPLTAEGEIPDGMEIELSGTAGKLEAAKGRFGEVLLLALVISFLLLAALFEDFLAPVAVLATVPLAAGGGVLGLWLVDRYLGPQPLDLMTALGFLILIGVVVNNAILVIDGALGRMRNGETLDAAIPQAVEARVRPIFMSTMTSLAGLLPMVLFSGSGSELYRGVGAIVLGGLALSTVLTLYVVPCMFALLWRLRRPPAARAQEV